ncbi:MAG TPA: N-glycosylase/DNA lyase [bacterium]|nr:N-glycosylase/DNA lyase [bacterium]
MNRVIQDVKSIYSQKKRIIEEKLKGFRDIWEQGRQNDILHELIFCIFTPQSKAVNCWACVEKMIKENLVLCSTPASLLCLKEINGVRFKNKKAVYACMARDKFVKNKKITIMETIKAEGGPKEMRGWLVKNIKGYGYKEASHFLRNIGLGKDIAILDRHILKNLVKMGVIRRVPESLSPVKYLEIEEKMRVFSEKTRVPMDALDLILWYREAGHFFK